MIAFAGERCRGVLRPASVSTAIPEAIDTGRRLKHHVYPRRVINVSARETVNYLSYLRNCVNWVSVLRFSQKSGDLGAGGSVGAGTLPTGPSVFTGILKEWLGPSPTDWSL